MTDISVTTAIAFYAPLKSPLHPIPSGDRKIARLFIRALALGGYHVELASQLRTFDKLGDRHRQQRLIALANKEAIRVMRRWKKQGFNPQAWFSYHLYYKAPDLIGPIICQKLNIPYIVAEASWAEKRAHGSWALYHQQVAEALKMATKVVCINPRDKIALTDFYADRVKTSGSPLVSLNMFIDDPFISPSGSATSADSCDVSMSEVAVSEVAVSDVAMSDVITREALANKYGLDPKLPWLITIAMMRSGDKFDSFRQLSLAVEQLQRPHQLLIIGGGVMQAEVRMLFAKYKQVKFAGVLENNLIRQLLPHFALIVWPAINEALGMVFLEAQQSGVAVVAGDQGGVSSMVRNKVTGILVDAYNAKQMSVTIDNLLANSAQLKAMKQAAQHYVTHNHSLQASARRLNHVIQDAILSDKRELP